MKKVLLALLFSFVISVGYSQPPEIVFEVVDEPKARLTKNWVFVIDTSHSIKATCLNKAKTAFLEATKYPTDELFFTMISFNNSGNETQRPWVAASVNELQESSRWIDERFGKFNVRSYGEGAISLALRQQKKELTIILITDGGFSEYSPNGAFGIITKAVQDGQDWRNANGYGAAIIASIGIENKKYTAGGKPSDEVCQAYLKELGNKWNGGYFFVREEAK